MERYEMMDDFWMIYGGQTELEEELEYEEEEF